MQTMTQLRAEAITLVKKYIAIFDEEEAQVIVHFDIDLTYLDIIKKQTVNQENIITISDVDEFKAFIDTTGSAKIYIDINMDGRNGIDFAEELKLCDNFSELIFVSGREPSTEDLVRIQAMGGKFISKERLSKTF